MTLVDSNVLLDVFSRTQNWWQWSLRQLEYAALQGPLLINDVIYAETSIRFQSVEQFDEALAETGATCVLSSELRRVGLKGRMVQIEEYLVHGVVLMQTLPAGRTMERIIQVEKMRETAIDRQPRPYRITNKGIEVYPRETVI